MEAGPQGRPEKRFITTLTFVHGDDTLDIDAAMDEARGLITCGEERSMRVLDGDTTLAREREPVESFSWGSEQTYRNQHALARERGDAWAQPVKVGATEAV